MTFGKEAYGLRGATKHSRVGKGALAPCPPSINESQCEWWERYRFAYLKCPALLLFDPGIRDQLLPEHQLLFQEGVELFRSA